MSTQAQQEHDRLTQLRESVPELFTDVEPGDSCLYIGASKARFECATALHDAGYALILVEAYSPNADYWRNQKLFTVVIEGDVREIVGELPTVDVVFWWHGPEHVTREQLTALLPKLESLARRLVILACPHGLYEQGAHEGNEYEHHLSHLFVWDFPGYNVVTQGSPNTRGSNLIAWKAINNA